MNCPLCGQKTNENIVDPKRTPEALQAHDDLRTSLSASEERYAELLKKHFEELQEDTLKINNLRTSLSASEERCRELESKVQSLEQTEKVDDSFHKLTVKERDAERLMSDRLRTDNAALRIRVENEKSIKEAEKKILLEEVEKNAALHERLRVVKELLIKAEIELAAQALGYQGIVMTAHRIIKQAIQKAGKMVDTYKNLPPDWKQNKEISNMPYDEKAGKNEAPRRLNDAAG